jgi:DNA-binding NarL/FixJ family response regulator
MTIRVLIVDDQPLVRTGLGIVLQAACDLEVAGEAADGEQAVRTCPDLRPDAVVMDIRMPVLPTQTTEASATMGR